MTPSVVVQLPATPCPLPNARGRRALARIIANAEQRRREHEAQAA